MSNALRLVPEHGAQDPRPDRLAEWARFMAAIGNTEATIRLRVRTMQTLLRRSGADHPDDLTRDDVIEALGRCKKDWTRLTYFRIFRSYDSWRAEFGELEGPVLTKGLKRPPKPDAIARPIDDKTIDRLLALSLTPRPHLYVRLALFQALRVHEIAKIRGEDVDVEGRWITVLGKGRSHRRVPLHPEVAVLAAEMPEAGYWFPTAHSDHVSAEGVSQTIGAALRMAGTRATAHQLRDTAATRIQRQFKDIRVTQSFLRHSAITSTQKYAGVSDDDLTEAVNGLSWGVGKAAMAAQNKSSSASSEDIARALLAALGVDPSTL